MKAFSKNNNQNGTPNALQQKNGSDTFFGVQAKLSIGKPNDKYEKEADSVAEKVVAKTQTNDAPLSAGTFFPPTQPSPIQKSPVEEVQKQEEQEEIQEKPLAESITPIVQLASEDEETVQEKCAGCEAEKQQVQTMPFEDVQRKEEEEIQQQEEEEPVQEKCDACESEEQQVQTMPFEEVQKQEEEEVQTQEEEETIQEKCDACEAEQQQVQTSPFEDVQKQEEEEVQTQEEEEVQTQEEEEVQTQEEEEVQAQEEEETVQEKCDACEAEEQVQTMPFEEVPQKTDAPETPKSNLESTLKSSKGGGSAMDDSTKSQMESGFGSDFSNVRIHTNSTAVQMNKELGAHAFTNGSDIYFNQGKYDSNSSTGKHLLAHELTHTVQQGYSKSNSNAIQRQVGRTDSRCRDLISTEQSSILAELRSGIVRMNDNLTHPEEIIGPNQSQDAIANITTHIRMTIATATELINTFSGGGFSFCVLANSCPSANACFISESNEIRLEPSIVSNLDRNSVGAILHEFKHFKQHMAHAENVRVTNQVLVHNTVDELGNEYEAAVVGAIFSGYQLSRAPRRGTIITSDGMRDNQGGSGQSLEGIPREAIDFAASNPEGTRPTRRDQLPTINSAYTGTGQIERNSNVVYYPVRRDSSTGDLTLTGENGNTVSLGRFSLNQINNSVNSISHAFLDSTEAQHFRRGNYRRGVLVIQDGTRVIREVPIRPTALRRGRAVPTPIDPGGNFIDLSNGFEN